MKLTIILNSIFLLTILSNLKTWRCDAERSKRGIAQLATLLKCITGKSVEYIGYGCFCGYGDKGGTRAIDNLDECCKSHDNCYGEVQNGDHCGNHVKELKNNPMFLSYKYTKDCTEKSIECLDDKQSCERKSCECDRTFAMCVAKAKFNEDHKRGNMVYSKCKD